MKNDTKKTTRRLKSFNPATFNAVPLDNRHFPIIKSSVLRGFNSAFDLLNSFAPARQMPIYQRSPYHASPILYEQRAREPSIPKPLRDDYPDLPTRAFTLVDSTAPIFSSSGYRHEHADPNRPALQHLSAFDLLFRLSEDLVAIYATHYLRRLAAGLAPRPHFLNPYEPPPPEYKYIPDINPKFDLSLYFNLDTDPSPLLFGSIAGLSFIANCMPTFSTTTPKFTRAVESLAQYKADIRTVFVHRTCAENHLDKELSTPEVSVFIIQAYHGD